MKKLILFIFLFFSNDLLAYVEDGDVFFCDVERHGAIEKYKKDSIYYNQPKKFKFKVNLQSQDSGYITFNKGSYFEGKIGEFKFDNTFKQIHGKLFFGEFILKDNSFTFSSIWHDAVEYMIATCSKF